MNNRYNINALTKGLSVLEAIGASSHGLTVTEVAKFLETNNATATRLCYTLMASGFIARDISKRYYPTSMVLSLGFSYFSALPKHQLVCQLLKELSDDVQGTVSLSILEGTEIVYLMRTVKKHYLPFAVRVGSRFPAYCSSMGKALLAFSPPGLAGEVIAKSGLAPLTSHTITNPNELMQELERIRSSGYAINDEESALGNRAVAGPILNREGVALAAINVALPAAECSRTELERIIAPKVLRTARLISEALLMFEDPFQAGDGRFHPSELLAHGAR